MNLVQTRATTEVAHFRLNRVLNGGVVGPKSSEIGHFYCMILAVYLRPWVFFLFGTAAVCVFLQISFLAEVFKLPN